MQLPLKIKPSAALGVLLAGITATYSNHFSNGFHFDDFHAIVDNPSIRSLHNTARFFTDATSFSVLPANQTYRPVVSASLALDYALGHGYSPFWFHLSTFLLFLGLVCILSLLYQSLMDKTRPASANVWLALFGAAWFGLHPAMAETVNYVIQRGDLFCTLGCVAALTVYARYPERRRFGTYVLPLAAALLSKPPAAVFPVLLALYVFFFETNGSSARHRVTRSAFAAIPSTVVTALLLGLQSTMTPRSFAPSVLSAADYRLTQPFVWLRYVSALLLPVHLNVDTDLTAFSSLNMEASVGLLFLATLAVAIWLTARRRSMYPIAFGLLWFVITQLPTSLYPLSEVENDHRMFFSFVGLILAFVWGAALLWDRLLTPAQRKQKRVWAAVAALLLLGAYGYGAYQRNLVWHDEESLWLDDVQKSPHNGRGLMNYALTQMGKGKYPVALSYFEQASKFTPNYPALEINLGVVNGAMADTGDSTRTREALRHFQRAIALAPSDDTTHAFYGRWLLDHGQTQQAIEQLTTAVGLNPSRMFQRERLIQAYLRAGNVAAAQQAFREASAIDPGAIAPMQANAPSSESAGSWLNLSLVQYNQQQYQQSMDSARHALNLDPKMAEAWNNIGAAASGMQQWDEAVRAEKEALALKPQLQIAQNNLALYERQKVNSESATDYINQSLALNRAGKFSESIAAARNALKVDPQSAIAWNNIAANYEALHKWDESIDAAQKALALKPDFELARNNLLWSQSQKKLGIH